MKLTWLGHSAFRLETGSAVILIDPFISGPGLYEGGVEKASQGVTHIVLTHGHDDHVGDTLDIGKKTGAQLVAAFELCMWLNGQGIENVNPGNHGGTVPCGDFTVSFVQALHSSGTIADGRSTYLGNPLGVVIKAKGEPVLYHMGDTDIFGDMALIEELHKPEIGLVPIGDRFTMGQETAALACKRFFNFRKVIPCHYGTFPIIEPNADRFVERMGDVALVPKIGEAVEL